MDKYGIIGFPLDHSFSPEIHNRAFNYLKINACYEKYEIPFQHFKESVLQLKTSATKGFNVTVPYKQEIIPYLDEIEPLAKKVGAVNTIQKSGNKWIGFNTDLYGFLLPLKDHLKSIASVLIIGAGGAANAVCFALLNEINIKVFDISNRTERKAVDLSRKLEKEFDIRFGLPNLNEAVKNSNKYDLIVNTTNVGMGNLIDKNPISIPTLTHNSTIVYDLIYNPKQTLFLESAQELNLKTINGFPMLIGQAKKSFKIWTGQDYPGQIITEELFYKNPI